MINNLNDRMVILVKNKIAECYLIIGKKSIQNGSFNEEINNTLCRQFFTEVILKFENDMIDYFNEKYKKCVSYGYEIIKNNYIFDEVSKDLQEIDYIKDKGYRYFLPYCPTLKLLEFYKMIDDFINKL